MAEDKIIKIPGNVSEFLGENGLLVVSKETAKEWVSLFNKAHHDANNPDPFESMAGVVADIQLAQASKNLLLGVLNGLARDNKIDDVEALENALKKQ